ncbi:unnamed protein product [Soboliphyme baturini]|uniref:FERM_M domain-containing protein n=1 Tax=Soboliphyme baturini TaxID=241478 RepID=A0A183J860_9BILA|nr:unnamed protein product [Soboliphyme baturini]
MNLRSTVEQQEFSLYYVIEAGMVLLFVFVAFLFEIYCTENVKKMLSNDEYVLDVTTALENMKNEYILLLDRSVWIHPLRWDNDLYVDVMFAQVEADYLEGLLVTMRTPDSVSVSVMDDIVTLGALIVKSREDWDRQHVSPQMVANVLPRIVQNIRHTSLQLWADRINQKLHQSIEDTTPQAARSKFLEVIQSWPLFGSKFYYIAVRVLFVGTLPVWYDVWFNLQHVYNPAVVGPCLLAVNKRGIHFLSLLTHEDLLSFRLNEILQTTKTSEGDPTIPAGLLQLKVGNLLQQHTIALETNEGTEIARIIGQYIYVDGQDKGIIYT